MLDVFFSVNKRTYVLIMAALLLALCFSYIEYYQLEDKTAMLEENHVPVWERHV